MNEDKEPAFKPLVHCDFCPVEACRDCWLKWGGKCPECKKEKVTMY